MTSCNQLQLVLGLWVVFEYFQIEATSNPANPKTGQPQLMVQLQSVGFRVAVFFPVHRTRPLNTRKALTTLPQTPTQ